MDALILGNMENGILGQNDHLQLRFSVLLEGVINAVRGYVVRMFKFHSIAGRGMAVDDINHAYSLRCSVDMMRIGCSRLPLSTIIYANEFLEGTMRRSLNVNSS